MVNVFSFNIFKKHHKKFLLGLGHAALINGKDGPGKSLVTWVAVTETSACSSAAVPRKGSCLHRLGHQSGCEPRHAPQGDRPGAHAWTWQGRRGDPVERAGGRGGGAGGQLLLTTAARPPGRPAERGQRRVTASSL